MSTKKKADTDEPINAVADELEETAMGTQETKEAVVYLGPDIDRMVNHGTVYEGGIIPAYLEEKIHEIPAIRGLLIPVSQYADVARQINLPAGRYKTLYDRISESI